MLLARMSGRDGYHVGILLITAIILVSHIADGFLLLLLAANPCIGHACHNGGNCHSLMLPGTAFCVCHHGWTGTSCDIAPANLQTSTTQHVTTGGVPVTNNPTSHAYTGNCVESSGCQDPATARAACSNPSLETLCPVTCGLCHPAIVGSNTVTTTGSTTSTTNGGVTNSSPVFQRTTRQPDQLENITTTCVECSGPADFCEQLYAETQCAPPNNYCINHVINHSDGSRTVTRGCGNFDTCYHGWYEGSSDNDRCIHFDENTVYTLSFDCTYCCTKDGCNANLLPDRDSLYSDGH